MRLQGLGSGSNGNCFALDTKVGTILIDAGISRRRIINGLRSLDINPNTVQGILITHAHTDHIAGLAVLSSHIDARVIATPDTIEEIRKKSDRDRRFGQVADRAIPVTIGSKFELGGYTIEPFLAIHDIAGACGFHIHFGTKTLSYTTDTGEIGNDIQEQMRESDYLIIESNHDRAMLQSSSRPVWLKRRIRETHLSNDEMVNVLSNVISKKTKMIALAHLSGECNSPKEVIRQVHSHHLNSDIDWDWVVCTRYEKSSLVSQFQQNLQIDGGLSNRVLSHLDLNMESQVHGLDKYF